MKKILFILFLFLSLAGCGDKKVTKSDIDSNKPNITQTPDVGKVEQVEVAATGTGLTAGAAVNEALKSAITQVNGTFVNASSANFNYSGKASAEINIETKDGIDSGKATEILQSQSFAEEIITNSNGTVSSFKVEKVTIPQSKNGTFIVEIKAKIAKFKAPEDSGKIKIVVMPLKSTQSAFNIGGRQVSANEVFEPIRQQIIDSLTQSGRFTVLDRQSDADIQSELGMITSGQTSQNDMAKLSQALSADVIWVGTVNSLSYDRNVRKLQTSDRELVGFSGKWSITQRLVNLTTRQIMLSDTFKGDFPTISPTTLGASFNENTTIANVQTEIVKKSLDSIISKTFPISIVTIDGDSVVISQGEGSVTEGTRYKVVKLGKEIKDPQTGQSLGNMETDCCEVIINKVTPKLSYGQIESLKIKLDGINPGVLQIREKIVNKIAELSPQLSGITSGESKKNKKVTSTETDNIQPSETKKEKDW
jgi:curli biogenesis system outer membrane secretion channel CsgG